jgi:hypothetical protein
MALAGRPSRIAPGRWQGLDLRPRLKGNDHDSAAEVGLYARTRALRRPRHVFPGAGMQGEPEVSPVLLVMIPLVVLALVALRLGTIALRRCRPEDVPDVVRAIAEWFRSFRR